MTNRPEIVTPLPQLSRNQIVEQLSRLGVGPGGILLVHTSFRAVGPVDGGPAGLIDSLSAAIGQDGTLVMPSMTGTSQPYEATTTPTRNMGIVAETFWRMPGVVRGNHPTSTFAARGPLAEEIVAQQPLSPAHGIDSPVGRVYERDGQVLLLGVAHSANTTIHLAESLADVPYRVSKRARIMRNGQPESVEFWETDHCCTRFTLADDWLRSAGLQSEGAVGNADARLIGSRHLVEVVTEQLHRDPTLFLHPMGACGECDIAWASIPSTDR